MSMTCSSCDTYQSPVNKELSWCYNSLGRRSISKNWHRRHWTTGDYNLLEWLAHKQQSTSDNPLDILISKEEQEDETDQTSIWTIIDEVLTKEEAKILWDYYYEGLTLKQIATNLGLTTPSAVFKRKNQALSALRKHLCQTRSTNEDQ